jgi:hypothetical protein
LYWRGIESGTERFFALKRIFSGQKCVSNLTAVSRIEFLDRQFWRRKGTSKRSRRLISSPLLFRINVLRWSDPLRRTWLFLTLSALSAKAFTGRRRVTPGGWPAWTGCGGAIPRWYRQSICRRRTRPLAAAPLEAPLATAIFVGISYTTARKQAAFASCNYPTD